ncbi:TPA: hypothetical protein DCW54_01580 [Candidatus Dependentiae bacterium]|nr:hypothetical protein [Candidatus Dependentiae bacterium]
MNIKKLIIQSSLILIALGIGVAAYKRYFKKEEAFLYQTEQATQRHIRQSIKATGNLEPEDMLKVGSLVPGIIKQMLAEENEFVKKGQLIAVIDDGREDSLVRTAEHALAIAQANYRYFEQYVARQTKLYESNYLAENEFQRLLTELVAKQEDVAIKEVQLEQEKRMFNKKQITAPEDGVVVGKHGSEGEMVTNFGTGFAIYTIAKDIRKMEAKIEIDESSVGLVKTGMTAQLMFDSYPEKLFESVIREISNNPQAKGGTVSYLATLPIANQDLLFKPGMTLDAEIIIHEKDDVLAVQGQVFAINPKTVEQVAQVKKYAYQPLDQKEKRDLETRGNIKFLWLEKDNAFVEIAVKTGATDGAYFEILEGLSPEDKIVSDTVEENAVAKMLKKMFNTGLK